MEMVIAFIIGFFGGLYFGSQKFREKVDGFIKKAADKNKNKEGEKK